MVSAPFDYQRVDDYSTAVAALVEHGEDAKILAGGQSLVPMLNLRLARPSVLVDINGVPGDAPGVDGGLVRFPALTRHRAVVESPLVREHCPMLSAAVSHVGNVRVRNRGTIGGSLAHADPTSEIGAVAVALGATVTALGPNGARRIGADDFFVTYLTTALEPTEVVTEVHFPARRDRQGWSFQELVRRTSDFAIVAAAASVELSDGDGTVARASLGLAGVADRVVHVEPERLAPLVGTRGEDASITEAAALVADGVDPDDDVHATGAYRKRMVAVLTRRALTEALRRAADGEVG